MPTCGAGVVAIREVRRDAQPSAAAPGCEARAPFGSVDRGCGSIEARPDQQDDRHRDLRDHEAPRVAACFAREAVTAARSPCSGSAICRVAARAGGDAEHEAGRDRRGRRRRAAPAQSTRTSAARVVSRAANRAQDAHRPGATASPAAAPSEREQQALVQHLPGEAAAARAEGRAHRQLAARAAGSARAAGWPRSRRRSGARSRPRRAAGGTCGARAPRQLVAQRSGARARSPSPARVRPGVRACEAARDRREVGPRASSTGAPGLRRAKTVIMPRAAVRDELRPRTGTGTATSACRRRPRPGTAGSAAARRSPCAAGRSSGTPGPTIAGIAAEALRQ